MPRFSSRVARISSVWILSGILVPCTILLWVGHRALEDLADRTRELVERSADQTLQILGDRLRQDMRGAFVDCLVSPLHHADPGLQRVDELTALFEHGLTRYDYPEAFFSWRAGTPPAAVVFHARSDRAVPVLGLHRGSASASRRVTHPALAAALVDRVSEHVPHKMSFAFSELARDGRRYQVAFRLFLDVERDRVNAFVGFLTDLDWVRREYFQRQLARVSEGPPRGEIALAILDVAGGPVAGTGRAAAGGTARRREFELLFFDPDHLSVTSPARPPVERWAAAVAFREPAATMTAFPATGAHVVIYGAAGMILLAVALAVRAMRTQMELAAMRTAFVSRVTHELKTPLSLIKAVTETLQLGRLSSPDAADEYYALLGRETTRLEQLIDRILAFGRTNSAKVPYRFEPRAVESIVAPSLRRFRRQLDEGGFAVSVALPADLPAVRAHQETIEEVFDNLIDNAIKHSRVERALAISAARVNGYVEVAVADRGAGIAPDEIPRVFEPFFRGRSAAPGGTGLGLAIVGQIVRDHGGYVRVERLDAGTVFTVGLVAEAKGGA